MKGVWGKSDDDDHTLSWYSRSDNRIFCVTICVALLSATAAAIYTYRSTTGQMLFAGCVFFLVLVAWLFVSVPVVAFAFMKTQASIADHKEKIVYETLAKSVNGRIYRNERFFGTRPPAIEFLHHGLRVVIDSEHRRAGGHYLHYARATLDLPRPIPFRCDLSPHGWLDAALIPGHQDVQIGASVFDDEFRVKTNDDKLVVQVLDETVQLRLMQLKGVSKSILTGLLDTGRVYLLIDAHRIQIRAQGVITESEEMTEFYRQSSELFNELLPRLGLLP